jgi:hypothetical protein
MIEDLEHIDELFRDSISTHEEDAPKNVWDSLQAKLDKEDATKYKRKFNSARRLVIALAGLLLFFLLFENGILKFGSQKSIRPSRAKNEEDVKPANDKLMGNQKFEKPQRQDLSFMKHQLQASGSKNSRNRTSDLINYEPDNEDEKIKDLHIGLGKIGHRSLITFIREKVKMEQDCVNQNEFLFPKINPKVFPNYQMDFCSIASLEKTVLPTGKEISSGSGSSVPMTLMNKKKQNQFFEPYWSITAHASPELANYNLQNDLTDNGGPQTDEKSQIEQREKHQHSFEVGLLASYQFKKHWAVESGLLYINNAISIDPEIIYAAKDANGEIGYKYNSSSGYAFVKPKRYIGPAPNLGDSIATSNAEHNLKYLSIPLTLKYKIGMKKFSIFPGIGVSFNFLTTAKIKTGIGDSSNSEAVVLSKLEGTKICDISLLANIGLQYNINRKLSFAIMPGFRYAVTPITKNNVVKTYPYSLGVAVGITRKL